MSHSILNTRHVALVGLYSIRYAVRSGAGLLFLLLVLTCGLTIASIVISPVEDIRKKQRDLGLEADRAEILALIVDQARSTVEWAVERPTEGRSVEYKEEAAVDARTWAAYLLDDRPALLSAVLFVLIFAMPLLVVTGAFNLFSGDVQTRGLRYLLIRTDRGSIFWGRILGLMVYSVIVLALLVTTISLYIGLKLRVYAFGDLFLWSVLGFAALVVMTLPYVAFCAWISSAIDSPFGSLAISGSIIGFIPLFAMLGRKAWWPLGHLKYLMPWGFQNRLLADSVGACLLAYLLCFAYAAVFLFLGHRHFTRRDL